VRRVSAALLGLFLCATLAPADDPPVIEHQPASCTIPGRALSICAAVSDDVQVARARVYFRSAEEKYFSIVEMAFFGMSYCATLPGVRPGRAKAIEYYVQAVDDQYQPQRTSTYRLTVEPEGVCAFPPLEQDAARAASIKVYATAKKQGKKVGEAFDPKGVTFIPQTTD
jgi:hypothetical protein